MKRRVLLGTLAWLVLIFLAACGGATKSSSGSPPSMTTTNKLYVTVYGLDEVTVIDRTSLAIVAHIPLASGSGPAILLKTPDGSKLYAAGWKNNTVSSIDPATGAVTAIPVNSRPWVIAMSPKGDFVYAGLNSQQIAVISTATDTVTRTIDTAPNIPESIIVSPDGATLYVSIVDESSIASLLGGSIEAITASTGVVAEGSLAVGMSPAWITISPDGSKVYTLNFLSNNVSVVDTASWTLSTNIPVGNAPIIGGVTATGLLVVTNYEAENLVVVDPTTNAVVHTLPIDGRPVGVDFSADGTVGYATDFGHASLSIAPDLAGLESGNLDSSIGPGPGEIVVFDPATGAQLGSPVAVGAGPTSIVVE